MLLVFVGLAQIGCLPKKLFSTTKEIIMSNWIRILALAVAFVLVGCGKHETLEIKGSDTMVNLGQAWAEAFQTKNPGTGISVTGGGSGTGIAALISGHTDIAQSSREIKDSEMEQARKNGLNPQEFVVARDGVSVIVNPANPISKLTLNQLADIFSGIVTNWKQVGGQDRKIVVLSRDKSSGTHVFFLEHIVRLHNDKAEFCKAALMIPSSQAIADEVANNVSAIGYVGMGYVDRAKHKPLAIAKDANSPYVEPTEENVIAGTYPIARPLYFYTPRPPEGVIRSFVDFVLSDEGQKIVIEQEFVPIRKI